MCGTPGEYYKDGYVYALHNIHGIAPLIGKGAWFGCFGNTNANTKEFATNQKWKFILMKWQIT